MNVNAQIDPQLRWFKYDFPRSEITTKTIVFSGKKRAYDVDALAALRAFTHNVRDHRSVLDFVRDYGPLFEPSDERVTFAEMGKARRAIITVWKAWQELDAKTLAQWRKMRREHLKELAEEGDPDPDYQPPAVTADDFPIVDPGAVQSILKGERLVFFSDEVLDEPNLLKARQRHVAPLFAKVRLDMRLEFDGAGLVLRPNDLHTAMWFVIAQRITLGDASILCRNAGCGNYVNRWSSDGNSMRAIYCAETRDSCTKAVSRGWDRGNKEVDRYPHLAKLKGAAFLKAVRELRGEEVL